jgi:hypothetical protein
MASATSTRSERRIAEPASAVRARAQARFRPTWAKGAFAAICALGLICWLAFPTYPTYDSLYALLWGRDLLHGHLPDIQVYRAPTEHPLALAFGALCSLLGGAGARAMVLGSVASFVALVAGVHRLTRSCFGPLVAALAAMLVLSRFFVENLALQGYLDVTYVTLVVWAAALELQRPRRGWPVAVLLCGAGLLRPEAWLLAGAYWLWCAWPAFAAGPRATATIPLGHAGTASTGRVRAAQLGLVAALARVHAVQLGLAALAPLVWMGLDAALTGDPLHSLHSTAGMAQELGRSQSLSGVLSSMWSYAVRIDKLPIVIGGIAGGLVALRVAPRRGRALFALLGCLLAAFVAEGVAGASVLDRYMLGASIVLLPFCALALGGWSLLERGGRSSPRELGGGSSRLEHHSGWSLPGGGGLRRVWMAAACVLAVYGVVQVNATLSLSSLRDTLDYHEQLDQGLAAALRSPLVKRSLQRCPLLSLPNNKLLPDARWLLPGTARQAIVARSQARELAARGAPTLERRLAVGSVAVYPLPVTHFFDAVAGVGEEPGAVDPSPGFRRIYASRSYAVYANC